MKAVRNNAWVAAMKNSITACFGNAEIVPEKYSTMITAGWLSSEQDDEFGITGIEGITAP